MRVDCHCHLLPAIDDGARDHAQAMSMVAMAVADGTTDVVCTPHHLNGVFVNDAPSVKARCRALQQAIDESGLALRLHPGAENHLVPELPRALEDGRALTLADRGRHVLIELPALTVPLGTDQMLKVILAQGLTPIIVHPERNNALRRSPEPLQRWVQWGCLGQLTAQSLTGEFGPPVQRVAKAMVAQGVIHCVASDAHCDRRRPPILSEAHAEIKRCFGAPMASLLADEVPQALLAGRSVEARCALAVLAEGHSGRALHTKGFGKPHAAR